MKDLETIEPRPLVTAPSAEEYIRQFLAYADVRESSGKTYTRCLRHFFHWLQDNGIRHPERGDIIAYRDDLLREHKATTVQSYLSSVKVFFKWTKEAGQYDNIAKSVKLPKVDNAGYKKDYLQVNQCRKLLKSIERESLKGKRDYAIILLMMTSGLRTIEVVRANVEDLQDAETERGRKYTRLYIMGKGRDDRTAVVKVAAETVEAIRDYLSERGAVSGKDPLFASISHRNTGERMTTRSVSGIAKDHLLSAGYDSARLTAHSLRHTAGTLAKKAGSSWQEVQQMLRHKDISTTMRYVHTMNREENESEERVARAIFA